QQLVGADAQDVAVDGGHPVQRPAFGVGGQQLVDPVPVGLDAADQLGGVLRHRWSVVGLGVLALFHQLQDGFAAYFGFEQQVKGALTRPATSGHSSRGASGAAEV